MTAVISSATQNACHTPTAPKIRLKINAAGMITIIYLQREIISDATPLLSPSNAPQEVTDTLDTIKPALIILRAVAPALIVSDVFVKSEIMLVGIAKQRTVPNAIIAAIIMST